MARAVAKEKFDLNDAFEIDRLDLLAKFNVDGFLQGINRSRKRGFSTEFSDFKAYSPGDDTRLLDWRIYARTDKLFIKQFEAETQLKSTLMIDATSSMAWRWGKNVSKLKYGVNLLASIALMHIKLQNKVGLMIHDSQTLRHLPARSNRQHLNEIFSLLSQLVPGSSEDSFFSMASQFSALKHQKGQILICSDLEENEDSIAEALEAVASNGDEVILLHILDKAEIELPFQDATHLKDSETGQLLPVHLPLLRKKHQQTVDNFREHWQEQCLNWGIQYVAVDTGMSYTDILLQLFEARKI